MNQKIHSFPLYLTRKRQQFGSLFSPEDLPSKFVPFYESQQRIAVMAAGDERQVYYGRVGVTSGHRPAFLLMHRSTDKGSSFLLSPNHRIVAVQDGRKYRRVTV